MISKFSSDIVLFDFFRIKKHFVTLINGCLFGGRPVMKVEDLYEYDSNLATVVDKGDKIAAVRRQEDIIFKWCYKGYTFLIGLENQKGEDAVMVLRVYNYQALLYNQQLRLLKGNHIKLKELMVVGSLVINWGDKRWKGPFDLHGLFDLPEDIVESGLVPNYQITVLQLLDMDYRLFKEKEVRDFIRVTQLIYGIKDDSKNLGELKVSKNVAILISSLVDEQNEGLKKLIIETEGETIDMCESLSRLMNIERNKGRIEGRAEGRIEGVLEKTKRLFNRYYPKDDDSFLQGLTNEEYDILFDMILDREPLDKIKAVLLN